MWNHTYFPFRRNYISASPHCIACAPSITAFIPEAHTLLVVQATELDKPAYNAACLAGACPTPA
jgi:hypothetical protein